MRKTIRFFRLVAVFCCVAGIARVTAAQETTSRRVVEQPLPENAEVKILRAQHDYQLVESLVMGYPQSLLRMTSSDRSSGVFTVVGTPDAIKQLEESISKYDKPAKNIELTFYLVEASNDSSASDVPDAVRSVIQELQGILQYKSYRVLQPVIVRVSNGGSAQINSTLPLSPMPQEEIDKVVMPGGYTVNAERIQLRGDSDPGVIAIASLQVQVSGPQFDPSVASTAPRQPHRGRPIYQGTIQTSVDIVVGQTVVVGKANVDSVDKAMFVVLTAKVVD